MPLNESFLAANGIDACAARSLSTQGEPGRTDNWCGGAWPEKSVPTGSGGKSIRQQPARACYKPVRTFASRCSKSGNFVPVLSHLDVNQPQKRVMHQRGGLQCLAGILLSGFASFDRFWQNGRREHRRSRTCTDRSLKSGWRMRHRAGSCFAVLGSRSALRTVGRSQRFRGCQDRQNRQPAD